MFENVVESILEKDPITSRIFLGAFAHNEIPKAPAYPSCFIINTEPRHLGGGHWLAVHYNKNGFCYFFDSYGQSPSYFELDTYLQNTSNGWTFNKKRIQGLSEYCGYYSVLFLLYKTRNQESIFFKFFGIDPFKNDKKIKQLIDGRF